MKNLMKRALSSLLAKKKMVKRVMKNSMLKN